MEKKRNIPKTFIGFLIASLLIWALINLSKEYSSVISYKIDYKQLPQDKLLQEKPIESIDLLIKGTGFKLFSAEISSQKIELNTNKLQQKRAINYYLLPNNMQLEIQQQLPKGLKLEEVLQDTIHLKIGRLSTKKVPVVANVDLQFQPGYNLSEKLIIKPDSILVSGPELQLHKIKSIKIDALKLENINESFSKEINLNLPENLENTRFNVSKVLVLGQVDKFTEGSFELPFVVENLPFGKDLKTFPKTVKVTYKVGLKNFGKITQNSFEIVCDYKHSLVNDLKYLIPKVKFKPSLVSSVKIEPNKIEYLIYN